MIVMYNKGIVRMGYTLIVECMDVWLLHVCAMYAYSCPNNVCKSQLATPTAQ